MTDQIDGINRELRVLWARERARVASPVLDLFPLQYAEMKLESLVFVGINPSHAPENEQTLRLSSTADLEDPKRIQQVIELDAKAVGKRGANPVAYYRVLNEFAHDWEHIDLFAIRDASQTEALASLQPDGVLGDFAEDQLKVFDRLLRALRPLTVVVVNAAASAILKKRTATRFSNDSGHHTIDLGYGEIPVFFSGMLAGQRALDVHSRERLVWHVRRALGSQQRAAT
jgi:hypothetical protein